MFYLKRGLVLFWSLWLTVVFSTNACDGLKELGALDEQWRFASGNFRFLVDTTARYDAPAWLNGVLFLGVILWEGSAAVLFWLAWWQTRRQPPATSRLLHAAFFVSIMLWGAFMLADELLMAYKVESTHLALFTGQLVTLLAIVLLPDTRPDS